MMEDKMISEAAYQTWFNQRVLEILDDIEKTDDDDFLDLEDKIEELMKEEN
jgi:hypothetical protein